MHRILVCLCGLIFLGAFVGCKNEPLPTKPTDETRIVSDPEQKEVLESLLKSQKATGDTLSDLSKEMARKEALEAQYLGPSPLQRDYAVARALLVSTRRAVHSEEWDTAILQLNRLEGIIYVMLAETPAGQIRTHLERAQHAIEGSAVGVQADVASASLLTAMDVALKAEDAPLVPELSQELEKTKKLVDTGDYKAASKRIEEYIGETSGHPSLKKLLAAAGGVRGARVAMEREAGLVVLAEIDQISERFNELALMLKAAPKPSREAPAAEEAEEEETEADAKTPEGAEEAEASPPEPAEPES